jgi:serine/threonine-protein phosphatase PGAM5
MGRKIIYLVRHGQAAYAETEPKDVHGYLTELGRQQAHLAAKRLAQLPITAIHHSDLKRASETAELIAKQLPHVPLHATALLRECIPCAPARPTTWAANVSPAKMQENQQRLEYIFTRYFAAEEHKEAYDVLVCHGNILRYLICRALQVPPQAWINADIHNCGISEVLIETDGRTMLISHNDTGHLPYTMRTFL